MSKVDRLIYFTKKHIGMDKDSRMYLEMIDKYNSQKNIPRGYKVMKRDAWGCIFVSVMALYAGLEEDIPIECSCYHQLQLFKKKEQEYILLNIIILKLEILFILIGIVMDMNMSIHVRLVL